MISNSGKLFIQCLLLIYFLLQIIDALFGDLGLSDFRASVNAYKNALLVVIIVLNAMLYILSKDRWNEYKTFSLEVRSILTLVIILTVCSLFLGLINSGSFYASAVAMLKFILPLITVYFTSFVLSQKAILQCMRLYMYICFIIYLLFTIFSGFSFNMFSDINWLTSLSPFESDMFSPIAIACFVYFCYNRQKKADLIIAVLFNFLTFKRVAVLFIPVLVVAGMARFADKKLSNNWIWGLRISAAIIVVIYYNFCMGVFDDLLLQWFGQSADGFTMGRSWRFRILADSDNTLRGLGTLGVSFFGNPIFQAQAYDYVFYSFEMDLFSIMLECSVVGLIATIWFITNLAKRSFYGFCAVIFVLIQMLTSHWYDITSFWIVFYFMLESQPLTEKKEKHETSKQTATQFRINPQLKDYHHNTGI